MQSEIVFIGECMIELRGIGKNLTQGFGGDTLNTALYLSRLLQNNSSVYYITALGQDPLSTYLIEEWKKEGINTDFVHCSPNKLPGIYNIATDAHGERSFNYWRQDSAYKHLLYECDKGRLQSKLNSAKLIYISGISIAVLSNDSRKQLFEMLEQAKDKGALIAFDNNFRPKLWQESNSSEYCLEAYEKILSLTDIAFLTFDDEIKLHGLHSIQECIRRTQSYGVEEIVIKDGSNVAYALTHYASFKLAPQKITNVVDTTAAGDSFSAAYLATRLQGGRLELALHNAHSLAGKVIQYPGAIMPIELMPSLVLH